MWTGADKLLDMFHMPLNEELDVARPSESREDQVSTIREIAKREIKVLDKIGKETINQYIIQPMKCMSVI